MTFVRHIGKFHENFRAHWVKVQIIELGRTIGTGTAIDIGAGLSPYKATLENANFHYFSQDSNSYKPFEKNFSGLQNSKWDYPTHTFVCDILDTPTELQYDLVLCTEVLEHVPDPVAAFKHLSALMKPGGYLLITVPFNSMMHQAPNWFSAGLSPWWFTYWGHKMHLQIVKLEISGDYIDVMTQEFRRLFDIRISTQILKVFVNWLQRFRASVPSDILSSGACGTLVLMQSKIE